MQQADAIQLYSAPTANGIKVAACLEELQELTSTDGREFDYEAHLIDIRHGEQSSQEFLDINPNGKIPAITDGATRVWESGSILLFLAEKYGELLPKVSTKRTECINWLFWASTTFSVQVKLFGFYFHYCPHKLDYCVNRYTNEVQRLLGVIETQLESHRRHFLLGDLYTIADIATWPWLWSLTNVYSDAITAKFDGLKSFPRVREWHERCLARPASKRAFDVTTFLT